jgi:hypothetical protein
VKFDNSKIKLITDSVAVDFKKTIPHASNLIKQWFLLLIKRQKYTLSLLPGATTDFYGITNDSLTFRATNTIR